MKQTAYCISIGLILFVAISCEFEDSLQQQREDSAELITTAVDDSMFAGAVLLVGSSSEILVHESFGYADRYNVDLNEIEHPVPMTNEHRFDVASLTKVLATTYGLMLLESRGEIDPDDQVHNYIPGFDEGDKEQMTIRHLLTHTSGLMQWFPSYYVAENPKERQAYTAAQDLVGTVGDERRYSDYGFMLLGDIIEQITEQPLNKYLEDEVYGPMGLHQTEFNPDLESENIVATSHGNPFEKKMVHDDDFGYTIDIDPAIWDGWRNYTLKGEVNDGNAFHTHDGVAGHAGLFSTADEVYRLLALLLNGGFHGDLQLFSQETIYRFLEKDEHGEGLGWMMTESSLHGKNLPEDSFGHTGFTGTNIVVSPQSDRIMVLLTNRQHPGVDEDGNYPNLRNLREELSSIWMNAE